MKRISLMLAATGVALSLRGWSLKVRGRQICLVREWGTLLIVR